jgi:hypothetical protein
MMLLQLHSAFAKDLDGHDTILGFRFVMRDFYRGARIGSKTGSVGASTQTMSRLSRSRDIAASFSALYI